LSIPTVPIASPAETPPPSSLAPTDQAAACAAADRLRVRAALVSLAIGALLLVVKYVAYVYTGSSAILSDALESIINVVAALFAVGGLSFASRPADQGHPYGHGKIEYFSAVFEGGLIAFAAVLIVWYAALELIRGPELARLELGLVLTIAAGGVNALLGWYLLREGRIHRSITLTADGKHVLSDFQTSAGVVVGLVLVQLTGIVWFDPLAALLVGVNLGFTGYRLVRQAAGGLLDEGDPRLLGGLVDELERSRVPGIIRVHRLRAIRSGRETHADAHVFVPEYWTVEQAHDAVGELERRVLATPALDGELVFHIDPCGRAFCSLCDVEGCPVRQAPFVRRPPLTVEEATATMSIPVGAAPDGAVVVRGGE
jgi:cation diffusion facilitator family transporter